MIVSINPSLFSIDEESIQRNLAKIVDLFFDDKFIWDKKNIDEIFIDVEPFKKTVFYTHFLSKFEQIKLLEERKIIVAKAAYHTAIHDTFLNKINIGFECNEMPLDIALKVISSPSLVIVENGNNDWDFFRGIVEKYVNIKSERKIIYKIISKAIKNNQLQSENAGGNGMIINRLTALGRGVYRGIHKFKIATFFDSDRNNDRELAASPRAFIRRLKNNPQLDNIAEAIYEETDWVTWHMLYKRGIENYVPLEILMQNGAIPNSLITTLEIKKIQELDFYKYDDVELEKDGFDIKNR